MFDRDIGLIRSEVTLSGPKDSFIENINTNYNLIKKRIKSNKLKVDSMNIGRYTDTLVNILYIDGIVKKDLVNHVKKRLNKIDIDGIIDSSYLRNSLEEKHNLFPTLVMTERPDRCSMALLEGKIVILVDNSPYAIILPSFFIDFFHTTDDYFQKSFNTSFIRIIRLIAFIISIFIPGLYICITARNYNLVPLDLLLVLKSGRTFVPFPAYIEALFMIICFEILKESDLRRSNISGSAISILGGLILGDAAVAAGIVSPIMIIVIAITGIGSFATSDYSLSWSFRILKLIFILLASVLGFYGIAIGIFIYTLNLGAQKSFGVPFLSPIFEIKSKSDANAVFVNPIWKREVRPGFLYAKNKKLKPEISRNWKNKNKN